MSYLLEEKYRVLSGKIDYLYNELKNEVYKLKEENYKLRQSLYTNQAINETTYLTRRLEAEIRILRAENAIKDIIISNLRKNYYKPVLYNH
jgi:hypothetical protein